MLVYNESDGSYTDCLAIGKTRTSVADHTVTETVKGCKRTQTEPEENPWFSEKNLKDKCPLVKGKKSFTPGEDTTVFNVGQRPTVKWPQSREGLLERR